MDNENDDFSLIIGLIIIASFAAFIILGIISMSNSVPPHMTVFFPHCDEAAPVHFDSTGRDYKEALTIGQTASLNGWSDVVIAHNTVTGYCRLGHF